MDRDSEDGATESGLGNSMKFCGDKNCRRSGKKLRLTQFPKNRTRSDGRNVYCRECSIRRVKEFRVKNREKKQADKAARALALEVQRKANILAATYKIKEHVGTGATREELHERTGFDYDELGDLLAVMTFDYQALRIERLPERKFVVAA